MAQRIKKDQRPGAITRHSQTITGLDGDTVSAGSPLFNRWIRVIPLPEITGLNFQRDVNESELLRIKRRTGYVQGEYDSDPAVVVIRRLGNPQDHYRKASYRQIRGLDGVEAEATGTPSAFPVVLATDRFIIQQVSEADEERLGPRYTFSVPVVYTIGRSSRIFTYGGWLIDNMVDGSGQAQWLNAYEKYMRGSKCIQNKCFAEVYYRDKIRRGYVMHTNMTEESTQPSRAQFAFTIFVISEHTFSIDVLHMAYAGVPPEGPSRQVPAEYEFLDEEGRDEFRTQPLFVGVSEAVAE